MERIRDLEDPGLAESTVIRCCTGTGYIDVALPANATLAEAVDLVAQQMGVGASWPGAYLTVDLGSQHGHQIRSTAQLANYRHFRFHLVLPPLGEATLDECRETLANIPYPPVDATPTPDWGTITWLSGGQS